jgi:phosphohistidine phosphatase
MNLYVMRHGIAVDGGEWNGSDVDRPLTAEGVERTHAVVKALKENNELQVDEIWSSPLRRARETAEIAGKVLGLNVKIVDQLECGASLTGLIRAAKTPPARLLTVGHEPDCGEIVADLIGDSGGSYPFKRAGIAHLQGEFRAGGMKLSWLYAPRDVLGD